MTNEAEVTLLRGARVLLERGWTRGVMSEVKDGRRCYCLVGALSAQLDRTAAEDARLRWNVEDALLDSLGWEPGWSSLLTRFNDGQKTVQPVLALIDRTIARLQEGGT